MRYTIEFEEVPRLLVCRMFGFLSEEVATEFGDALAKGIAEARKHSNGVRVLFDNSQGQVASPQAAQMLADQLRKTTTADDRTAIIVANSLHKLQAKRAVSTLSEIFISESAARTWLSA